MPPLTEALALSYVSPLIFGGPCRGRTHGPLIKSLVEDISQNTLQEESSAKSKDS